MRRRMISQNGGFEKRGVDATHKHLEKKSILGREEENFVLAARAGLLLSSVSETEGGNFPRFFPLLVCAAKKEISLVFVVFA